MAEYKSAREIMIAMNKGEIQRKHLGPKNFHILKQELFSHKNQYNPTTSTAAESIEWHQKLYDLVEEIEQLPESEQTQLFAEVDQMLNV